MKDKIVFPIALLALSLIFVGAAFGQMIEKKAWEKELVRRNLAEYNSTNRNWQWKEIR